MANQPLNAAKAEYLSTDLGGATICLVAEVIGPNSNTSAVSTSQNSPG
jgi:hypothetical protein